MPTTRRSVASKAKPTPGAHRSRKEQGEQTRRAILKAAVELYAEGGVRGTGLIAIGARAGVHHTTVLYHFGSSRRLLVAVLKERDRRFFAFAREAFRAGGLEALRELPVVAHFNLANPVWAKLFSVVQVENVEPGAEVHDYVLNRRLGARGVMIDLVREGQMRGEIRADVDPAKTVDAVLAFTAGAQIHAMLDPAGFDLLAVYERFTEMLVRDLTHGVAGPGRGAQPRGRPLTRPAGNVSRARTGHDRPLRPRRR